MSENLYIICVLYNNTADNIESLSNFKELKSKHPNVNIVVVDNSESADVKQRSRDCSAGLIYIDNNGNKGLSKAYNRALANITDESFWIMISDDDTLFSMEYLENAYNKAMAFSSKVISGIVKTNEAGVLSPLRRNTIRPKAEDFISTAGTYSNIFCINSGLFIHSSVIKEIGGYDERLFLDMIDYWMMDKLIEKDENRIEIVEGAILQQFSGTEKSSKEALKRRFSIYKKDFSTYCDITNKNPAYKYSILFKRVISIYMPKWVKSRRR